MFFSPLQPLPVGERSVKASRPGEGFFSPRVGVTLTAKSICASAWDLGRVAPILNRRATDFGLAKSVLIARRDA